MAKEKEVKTNAMRMLDKLKLPYKVHLYECDEFIDASRPSSPSAKAGTTTFSPCPSTRSST